jgi:hypothetical protein
MAGLDPPYRVPDGECEGDFKPSLTRQPDAWR